MSLRLVKRADSPGLTYVNAETGHRQFAWDIKTLMLLIAKYRTDNGFPGVTQEEVENQLCQTLPPDWCRQSTGGAPADYIDTRIGINTVMHGTIAMGEIAARRAASVLVPSWTPFVDQAEADRRAAICVGCYAKTGIEGCASCSELFAIVGGIIGDRKTKHDSALIGQACAVCKCAASAQVHVKADILSHGVDDAMLAKFPPFCWKSQAIREYRLTEQAVQPTPTP